MMLRDTLKRVLEAQKADLQGERQGIPRYAASGVEMNLPHAVTITGVRRCGKSTLLRQLMTRQSAYCSFEDPNLIGFTVQDFPRMEDAFRDVFGEFTSCMLDEIQNVPDWERYVGRTAHKFVITGSNASLLSREFGTRLTGRHLTVELFPFSYGEALAFSGGKPGIESFKGYFRDGGFPGYLKYKRIEILTELFKDILVRDIAVRYGVRDSKALQELALYLFAHVGKEFSHSNLADLFAFGSTHTVGSYLSHMEESYLLFVVPRFSFSLKKQRRNPKKVYAVDTGFCRANSVAVLENDGQMLENLVFLALRRRAANTIFYFKETRECDFVVRTGGKIDLAIQVCFQLNEDNMKREIEGLREAMAGVGAARGLILTMDQEDVVDGIPVMPVWKWCLDLEERDRADARVRRGRGT